MSRVASLFVVTCLLAAGCSADGVTESPSVTPVPSTIEVAARSTSTSSLTTTTSAPPTTDPVITATDPDEPAFLIAGADGISRVTLDGTVEALIDGVSTELAYADGTGGVIYQEVGSWLDPRPILHWQEGEPGAEVLVVGKAAEPETGEAVAVKLRGVEIVGGSLTVLYTSITFWCEPPWQDAAGSASLPVCDEPIHALDVATGDDRVVGHLGGWECAARGPVTMAGGSVVGVTAYYFDDSVQLFSEDHPATCEYLELPEPQPPADGWVASEAPGHYRLVALSSDGETLAMTDESSWTRVDGDTSTTTQVGGAVTIAVTERTAFFAVIDRSTGQEVITVDIAEWLTAESTIAWLDYDGEHAVVSFTSFDPETELARAGPSVVLSPDGDVTELPVTGLATIWR